MTFEISQNDQQILNKHKGQIPVPIVAIASDLGIKIYETLDFDDAHSGSITKNGESFVIYLNATHSPKRKRFTLAHEIAHFLLHKKQLEGGAEHIDSTKQLIDEVITTLNRNKNVIDINERKMESEANNLAACILMPELEFKAVWSEVGSIEELAERFNVSDSAAAIRSKAVLGSFAV